MKFEDYIQLYYSKFSMTIHVQGLILKIKGMPKYKISRVMIRINRSMIKSALYTSVIWV